MAQSSSVSLSYQAGQLLLKAPLHGSLSRRSRAIGGHFDNARKLWLFDAAAIADVRKIIEDLYSVTAISPADRNFELQSELVRLEIRAQEIERELSDLI